jgi:hypothetical protein
MTPSLLLVVYRGRQGKTPPTSWNGMGEGAVMKNAQQAKTLGGRQWQFAGNLGHRDGWLALAMDWHWHACRHSTTSREGSSFRLHPSPARGGSKTAGSFLGLGRGAKQPADEGERLSIVAAAGINSA